MNKVKCIEIVSLSAGTIGEDFVAHEIVLGEQRLSDMGVKVKYSKHAKAGRAFIAAHPECRAQDLLDAFNDDEVDMILCAIGGEDTYKLAPYLFEGDKLKNAVKHKIFLGFSDSTINHLMLNKVGLNTYYGQSFLADLCEMCPDMLPYSKKYFLELVNSGKIAQITPSDVWYEGRTDFSPSQVGTLLKEHKNKGFELLQGSPVFGGKILGGCLDSIYDVFDGERFEDMPTVCKKYELFPSKEFWVGKILLLETSEEKMSVEKYRKGLRFLKEHGVFDAVNGVIFGKPMDEYNYSEYKQIIKEELADKPISILYNVNIGHATPRCIIPFGVDAVVDAEKQTITFNY